MFLALLYETIKSIMNTITNSAKIFFSSIIIFLALDWIWFTVFMKSFALRELRPLLRLNVDGSMNVHMGFAISAYVVMALFMVVFLLPKIIEVKISRAVGYSALMGFLVFGIFDFTNAALLRDYPNIFVLADMAWGTFLYAVTGSVLWWKKEWLYRK